MTLRRSPLLTAKLTARASDLAAQGDTRTAERITKRLGKRPKRMNPRRAKFAGAGHWELTRSIVHARQRGLCCRCQRPVNLHGWPVMCGSHVDPLRMGGCRDDASNPRNHEGNVAGLCVACDGWYEAQPVATRRKWQAAWLAGGTWAPAEVLPGHGSRRGR